MIPNQMLTELANGMLVCVGPVGKGEFIAVPFHALNAGASTFLAIFDDVSAVWYIALKALVDRIGLRDGDCVLIPRRVFGASRAEAFAIARREEESERQP